MEFVRTKTSDIEQEEEKIGKREDIVIEKGTVLTEHYLEENRDLLEKYVNYFTAYPDA